ncbi:hypothetical protein [Roseibacillus persicicus]|uniref:Uncharacterized protein n=1 Tax=Roseibacillus persicicus TaxID=454148 RepID=A0A918TUC6_9BACT|nr:hypothetical protein GCM10007100_32140 [Roseibacillus persicicus]
MMGRRIGWGGEGWRIVLDYKGLRVVSQRKEAERVSKVIAVFLAAIHLLADGARWKSRVLLAGGLPA